MTEQRLIHGSPGEQRYLHSDEVFRKERNWNINLPSEREFKDGYCIITDKDNTAYSTDELVELLNEFQNENGQLKHRIKKLQNELNNYSEIFNELNALVDENEELKQFQDRVFSWIDMHLQRLPTLRDDEFESDNEFADPSLYSGAIQILETMKRELKGDVE